MKKNIKQVQHASIEYGLSSERITLKTADNINLAAWRTRANEEATKGTILIVSGMEYPSVTAYFGFAKMFSDAGWDALLIEMRSRGLSEGNLTGIGMKEWLDVKAGVDYLAADDRVKGLPVVAMGTSMGGATVIAAAGEIDSINGVIALSAFASVTHMLGEVLPRFGIPKFAAKVLKPFVNMVLGVRLGFGALRYTALNGMKKLGARPILLMHSTGDDSVPFSQYIKLLETAKQSNVNVVKFEREGNHHFICYDEHFEKPIQDTEFSHAIIGFIENNFKS